MEQIVTSHQRVLRAMCALKIARKELELAGAVQTLERVRSALKSADGARRHARLAPHRLASFTPQKRTLRTRENAASCIEQVLRALTSGGSRDDSLLRLP